MRLVCQLMAGLLLAHGLSLSQAAVAADWSDAPRLERLLRESKVAARTELGTGITDSLKVTLESNGERHEGIFKQVDSGHDSWRREVAAYELDKLLGLGMVPPTVEREIRGRRGGLQLWVQGVTLAEAVETPPDLADWRQQVSSMWLFDDLIANPDRHLRNALVTPQHELVLIDNSRAFKTGRDLLHDLNRAGTATRARFWMVEFEPARVRYPTTYPEQLVARLKSLTERDLKAAIGRYIDGHERRRLWHRRELILRKIAPP